MYKKNQEFRLERELLKQLARTGSPVDMSVVEDTTEKGIEILQTGCFYDSKIFELESGQLGFMASVAITNQTARPIYIADVELRSALIDDFFQWLKPQDFRRERPRAKANFRFYKFPGQSGIDLPFDTVLNHILFNDRVLRMKPLEGWLLGVGGPMPNGLSWGGEVELPIVITASDHREYRKDLRLWVERNEAPRSIVKRRSTLFDDTTPESLTNNGSVNPLRQYPSVDSDRESAWVRKGGDAE